VVGKSGACDRTAPETSEGRNVVREHDVLGRSFTAVYSDLTVISFHHQIADNHAVARAYDELRWMRTVAGATAVSAGVDPPAWPGEAPGDAGDFARMGPDGQQNRIAAARARLAELSAVAGGYDPLRLNLKVSRENMRTRVAEADVSTSWKVSDPDVSALAPSRVIVPTGGTRDGRISVALRATWLYDDTDPSGGRSVTYTVEFAARLTTVPLVVDRVEPHRGATVNVDIATVRWLDASHGELTAGVSGASFDGVIRRSSRYTTVFTEEVR
jgi:hypothetical protein